MPRQVIQRAATYLAAGENEAKQGLARREERDTGVEPV
jgi:hypothetical protein